MNEPKISTGAGNAAGTGDAKGVPGLKPCACARDRSPATGQRLRMDWSLEGDFKSRRAPNPGCQTHRSPLFGS